MRNLMLADIPRGGTYLVIYVKNKFNGAVIYAWAS